MSEYKTYLHIDTEQIDSTEALAQIREIDGVDIELAF